MAILPVYQAKALRELYEGGPNPEVLQEPHSATEYSLGATKVMVQALGRAMSLLVVQERDLWLNLPEMWEAEKVCFLDVRQAPVLHP